MRTIEKIDSIQFKHYKKSVGGKPITIGGIKSPDIIHYYFYVAGSIEGNLLFIVNYKNKVIFNQNYISMNSVPSQEEIDLIRPIMNKIEIALEEACDLPGLGKKMQEMCSNVICDHT